MKSLLATCACFVFLTSGFSQTPRVKADKYPSLLWEITGKGLAKPSYLFGTMHVSSKMVFHLSDSFYLAIQNAQVVALETNPGTWQDDFSRYDLNGDAVQPGRQHPAAYEPPPQDFLTINTLKLPSFEKRLEAALYSSPSIINSFLYRSNSESSSDFEEDTYLDLHIYQTGRKLGKRICGVEDFDGSMQLVKEAYADAAREKKKPRSFDYDDDFSYARMEEAYRTGNLDLLDTINKVNSQSAAFDEKFLYRRNAIQGASIDSILRSRTVLFVGVGAAHLPGERGVIELLRQKGYRLRPVKMTERDSQRKEGIEKIKVPVRFTRQTSDDGFFSVSVPGKLYSFGRNSDGAEMRQFADMVNGSYYMVTRLHTNAAIMGLSEAQVRHKLDSVLYENIPGKIISKKRIAKDGYNGYDIVNRTRRGDVQRYQVFVTPFEVIIFKMSGNGDYVQAGREAAQFFSSIRLNEPRAEWTTWSPANGGFEVALPHVPHQTNGGNVVWAAVDRKTKTAYQIIRTDIHNYDFLEQDSLDLELMEESFSSSDPVSRRLSKGWTTVGGYPALDATFRYKDSSLTTARFLLQGPHYYTLLANTKDDAHNLHRFFASFSIRPFNYAAPVVRDDSLLQFRTKSPLPLQKKAKLEMYPGDEITNLAGEENDSLVETSIFKSKVVESDSTGEKIYMTYLRSSPYFSAAEKTGRDDSAAFRKEWVVRRQSATEAKGGWSVRSYELGNTRSSRLIMGKIFSKNGAGYKLESESDTLSAPSSFVSSFFNNFLPLDTVTTAGIYTKKTPLFFAQFFSTDTLLHKKAVKNIGAVEMDSTDFFLLKKSIESLTWNEKEYLPVKKELIQKLSAIQTELAADYLKALYDRAGDTVELQYSILNTLLGQQTAQAYRLFGGIMAADPPVPDIVLASSVPSGYQRLRLAMADGYDGAVRSGSFLDNLHDSLALTAGIINDLLPLLYIHEYEDPVMAVMGRLVDSAMIAPADYEAYLPKLLLEAKQLLKRQLIQEKNKAIEKAKNSYGGKPGGALPGQDADLGNQKLTLYATLLLPFWDSNASVQPVFEQLLRSRDQQLQLETVLLLLRHNRPVADTLLQRFASLDEYRYVLFARLNAAGKEALFPAPYKTQRALAQSRLFSLDTDVRPDTISFLQKVLLPGAEGGSSVYLFKYKEKKEDGYWKLGLSGLFPQDSTTLVYEVAGLTEGEAAKWDVTAFTGTKLATGAAVAEQLEKQRRKLLYSRRKNAARFYTDDESFDDYSYPGNR